MFGAIDGIRNLFSDQALVLEISDQKLSNYIFGPPAAFAAWYSHADVSGAEWGAQTFANEFDLLHLRTRIIGRYTETSNLIGTEKTNVYTLFRGLVEDFTELGAVLICACIGGLAGWLYCVRCKKVFGALFWLSAFYAAFLYSPIVSLFSFNGAALAWLVAWFVLARAKPLPSLTTPLTDQKAEVL
jgi:oligosaccharide repeat unit polymerase